MAAEPPSLRHRTSTESVDSDLDPSTPELYATTKISQINPEAKHDTEVNTPVTRLQSMQIDAELIGEPEWIDKELENPSEPSTPIPSQPVHIIAELGNDTEATVLTPLPVQIGVELRTDKELTNPVPSAPAKIDDEIRKEMGLDNDDEHYNTSRSSLVLPKSPESQLIQLINTVVDLRLRSSLETSLSQLLDQHANDYYILEEERLKWIEDKQDLEEALADLTKRYEKAVRELNFFTTKSSELAAKGVQKRKSRKSSSSSRNNSSSDNQTFESRTSVVYTDQDPESIPPWRQSDGNISSKTSSFNEKLQRNSVFDEERQDKGSSSVSNNGPLPILHRRESSAVTTLSSTFNKVAEERRKYANDDKVEAESVHTTIVEDRVFSPDNEAENFGENTGGARNFRQARPNSRRSQSSTKSRTLSVASTSNRPGTFSIKGLQEDGFPSTPPNEHASGGRESVISIANDNVSAVASTVGLRTDPKPGSIQEESVGSSPPAEIVIVRPSFDSSPLEVAVVEQASPHTHHTETNSEQFSRDGSLKRNSMPLQSNIDSGEKGIINAVLSSTDNHRQESPENGNGIKASHSSDDGSISLVDSSDNYLQHILSRPSVELEQLLSSTYESNANPLRPSLSAEPVENPSPSSSRRASTIETNGTAESTLAEQEALSLSLVNQDNKSPQPKSSDVGSNGRATSPIPRESISSSRLSFDSDQEVGSLDVSRRRRHKEIGSMMSLDKIPSDLKPPRKNSGTSMSAPAMIPGLEESVFLQRRNEPLKFGSADSGSLWSMFKVPDEHTVQKVVSNYLRRGGNPNVAKPTPNDGKILFGYSMLHACIVNESIKCLTLLLQAGANPDAMSICSAEDDRASPVYLAVKNCFMDGLHVLVQYKADFVVAQGPRQRTVLMAAAESGDIRMLRYVIEMTEGTLINVSDRQGVSALHLVCSSGVVDGLRLLAGEHRANIEQADSGGETCFHYAVRKAKFDIIKTLVEEFRADPNICLNKKTGTPVDTARKAGYKKIEEYLRSTGGHPYKEWLRLHSKGREGRGGLLKF
ncbi:hypothetical protein BC937DRAFT_87478 [Endogone sp. FLAS-F59071]|nr:hypothetical protein BC937DRAFT_87478 [Endogone sp. FLAS-F59071]|eukprot:RUS22734.1 hypothetical protein BC937DRAFT_87478 [Endogone sp. FLAS-F59071]